MKSKKVYLVQIRKSVSADWQDFSDEYPRLSLARLAKQPTIPYMKTIVFKHEHADLIWNTGEYIRIVERTYTSYDRRI